MRGTRLRHLPGLAARRMASGLTLLEMLVVFVLVSLVGTLLIQGAGFFLGQYDNVKRIGREASSEALQQRWFASTVHGMLPYLSPDRNFAGDAAAFQGVTLQPLGARSGVPVAARWAIVETADGAAVIYMEQTSPCLSDAGGTARDPASLACPDGASAPGHAHWTVFESDQPLTFQYAGLDRVWRELWPIAGTREWIPRQVRLVTTAGQTLWTASFGLYQEPFGNPRDFQ